MDILEDEESAKEKDTPLTSETGIGKNPGGTK
jgi:hypothetical protein